jgi:hypothetical protein
MPRVTQPFMQLVTLLEAAGAFAHFDNLCLDLRHKRCGASAIKSPMSMRSARAAGRITSFATIRTYRRSARAARQTPGRPEYLARCPTRP